MYIPIEIITEIWKTEKDIKNYGIELDASDTQVAQIFGIDENKEITINLYLTDEYLQKLQALNVKDVAIYYNPKFVSLLKKYYPQRYPSGEKLPLYKIELLLTQFQLANKLSSYENHIFKNRILKTLQDIIIPSGRIKKILIKYGSQIDFETIEVIKKYFSETWEIEFTTNERGIFLVVDDRAYQSDPALLRLKFIVIKMFDDLKYKNFKIVDTNFIFKEYFEPLENFYAKLVIFVGKTPQNIFNYKAIKIFDPFAKIIWLTKDNLISNTDALFDSIINKVSQDYTAEYSLFSKEKEEKKELSQIEIQNYRKILTSLSQKFNIKFYIEIAYDLLEKSKEYDVSQQIIHLMNILSDTRYTPPRIFENLMVGMF